MRRMIQKTNDEATVKQIAEEMIKWAGDDRAKRIILRDYCRQVAELGYGSEAAQATLKKLGEVAPPPKDRKQDEQVEQLKQMVVAAQAQLDAANERALWAERMAKRGFISAAQAEAEQARFFAAKANLAAIRAELDAVLRRKDVP